MTTWTIIMHYTVGVICAVGILLFLAAVAHLFSDRTYHPMSPDEEYEWLTKECGLTHDEAIDVFKPRKRSSGNVS